MELKETQSQWGNLYKRRYFLDGERIAESHANSILSRHMYEQIRSGKDNNGNWFTVWNIGPKDDSPSLMDTGDLI